ncbi:MAG: hypothetical protein MHPSP_000028 [Paramarteilia canceri]
MRLTESQSSRIMENLNVIKNTSECIEAVNATNMQTKSFCSISMNDQKDFMNNSFGSQNLQQITNQDHCFSTPQTNKLQKESIEKPFGTSNGDFELKFDTESNKVGAIIDRIEDTVSSSSASFEENLIFKINNIFVRIMGTNDFSTIYKIRDLLEINDLEKKIEAARVVIQKTATVIRILYENASKNGIEKYIKNIKELLDLGKDLLLDATLLPYISVEIISNYFCILEHVLNSLISDHGKIESGALSLLLQQHFETLFTNFFSHPNQFMIPIIHLLQQDITKGHSDIIVSHNIRALLKCLGQIEQKPEQIYLPTVLVTMNNFFKSYSKIMIASKCNSRPLKAIKYTLKSFEQIYGRYLDSQAKMCCDGSSVNDVIRYITRIRTKSDQIKSNSCDKIQNLKEIQITTDSEMWNSDTSDIANDSLFADKSGLQINLDHSYNEILSAKEIQNLVESVKNQIVSTETCYEGIKNLWKLMRTNQYSLELKDILNDLPDYLFDIITDYYHMYEILKPSLESEAFSNKDFIKFRQENKIRLLEQLGKIPKNVTASS